MNELELKQKILELEQRIEALEEKGKRSKAFKPPTEQDVFQYMVERCYMSGVDAHEESQKFMDFYGSKNWMIGKNKMQNYKLAVNNWVRRRRNEISTRVNGSAPASKFERSLQEGRNSYFDDSI